jgi:Flp pilus assembly CpaE family ATPase
LDTAEVIREVPFFKNLREEDVKALQEICHVKGALAGTKLFDQGEPSDSFFIVVAGRVDIRCITDAGTSVYTMEVGDFFGEMGVIRNSPRSGTAFIAQDSVFLQIMKYDFDRLMAVNKFFAGMVMDAFLLRTQITLGDRTQASMGDRIQANEPEGGTPSSPAPPPRRGKVITVFSPIGGAGTTVLAANIAMKIKDFTKGRVLIMDACYQFGVLTTVLGARSTKNVAEVTNGVQIRSHTVENYVVTTSGGLDLFPAPKNPEDGPRFTPSLVGQLVQAAAASYDYVIVDTPSVMEERNLTILDHSDQIYMVLVPEVTAVRRLLAWLALMSKLGYPPEKIHILLNKDMEEGDITPELISKRLDRKLLGVIPYDYENMGRSINTGNLVVEGNPLCDVSVEISNMVRESLFPPEEKERKRNGFLYRLFGGS